MSIFANHYVLSSELSPDFRLKGDFLMFVLLAGAAMALLKRQILADYELDFILPYPLPKNVAHKHKSIKLHKNFLTKQHNKPNTQLCICGALLYKKILLTRIETLRQCVNTRNGLKILFSFYIMANMLINKVFA